MAVTDQSLIQNSDTLNTLLLGLSPEVRHDIHVLSRESGGNTLGTTCMNIYACNNYMAPQHPDHDQGMSVCMQLVKEYCKQDEYNFAYTEWGVYIVTEPWCVW